MNRTMMNGLQAAGIPMPPPAAGGMAFPGMPGPGAYGEMFGRMMGGGTAAPEPPKAKATGDAQPSAFEQMMTNNPFAAMLAGMMRAASRPSEDPPEEPPPPPPTAAELNYEAMSKLFQTGRDVQDQYLQNLQDIFSKMLGQPARQG
jgi:hypothetical protein